MIRTAITRNLGVKIASLSLAILAWMIFSGSRQVTMSISVPVQYRNLPRDLEISSEMVEQVHLNLLGAPARLARIQPTSMPIVIDLNSVQSDGERTFSLNEKNVDLPIGISLERAVPSQIRLTLEVRSQREVPVQARFLGGTGPEVACSPAQLTIIGPMSRVNRVAQVDTDPIDPALLKAHGEVMVEAFSADPQVHFAGSARVRVSLRESSKKIIN